MKSKSTIAAFAAAMSVLVGFGIRDIGAVRGQEAAKSSGTRPGVVNLDLLQRRLDQPGQRVERRLLTAPVGVPGQTIRIGATATPQANADFQNAIKKLKDAGDEPAKIAASKEVSALLDAYFENDMKQREKSVVDLEERVAKLRAQLDKRRAAKEKIVELQLRVMINESEGLGFFGLPTSHAPVHSLGYYYTRPKAPIATQSTTTTRRVPPVAPAVPVEERPSTPPPTP